MINAIKDYGNMVWKPSITWLQKHWKFYLVLNAIMIALTFIVMFPEHVTATIEVIKERFTGKKGKENE